MVANSGQGTLPGRGKLRAELGPQEDSGMPTQSGQSSLAWDTSQINGSLLGKAMPDKRCEDAQWLRCHSRSWCGAILGEGGELKLA